MELSNFVWTIATLIFFYIISHVLRFTTKKNFCAKCSALLLTIIALIILKYPIGIIALLLGELIAILSYYIDDYLLQKKINKLAQDFIILLLLIIISLIILMVI